MSFHLTSASQVVPAHRPETAYRGFSGVVSGHRSVRNIAGKWRNQLVTRCNAKHFPAENRKNQVFCHLDMGSGNATLRVSVIN